MILHSDQISSGLFLCIYQYLRFSARIFNGIIDQIAYSIHHMNFIYRTDEMIGFKLALQSSAGILDNEHKMFSCFSDHFIDIYLSLIYLQFSPIQLRLLQDPLDVLIHPVIFTLNHGIEFQDLFPVVQYLIFHNSRSSQRYRRYRGLEFVRHIIDKIVLDDR